MRDKNDFSSSSRQTNFQFEGKTDIKIFNYLIVQTMQLTLVLPKFCIVSCAIAKRLLQLQEYTFLNMFISRFWSSYINTTFRTCFRAVI